MAFRYRGNQLAAGAGRALLGAPTRLRARWQQAKIDKFSDILDMEMNMDIFRKLDKRK